MRSSDGGKGSYQRPREVDVKTFDNNWDDIFGKNKKPAPETTHPNAMQEKVEIDTDV